MSLRATLSSDATLDAAFVWLCKRRRDYLAQADVCDFRCNWRAEQADLHSDIISGAFCFRLLDRMTNAQDEELDVWSERILRPAGSPRDVNWSVLRRLHGQRDDTVAHTSWKLRHTVTWINAHQDSLSHGPRIAIRSRMGLIDCVRALKRM